MSAGRLHSYILQIERLCAHGGTHLPFPSELSVFVNASVPEGNLNCEQMRGLQAYDAGMTAALLAADFSVWWCVLQAPPAQRGAVGRGGEGAPGRGEWSMPSCHQLGSRPHNVASSDHT